MADVVATEHNEGKEHNSYASNTKANAGLTLGIIGTALGGLTALGGMTGLGRLFNGTNPQNCNINQSSSMTEEDLYIERKQAQNYIDVTKEFYEGKLQGQKDLANAFFDAYKRDVDNSFLLYKGQRDSNDLINNRITDVAFGLYKNHRDDKDALNSKIAELQNKVDVMQAIRPYQDALINSKIDKNALMADFNLAKRTCRMIEGDLVLPNTETTGYTSVYSPCCGR